MLCLGGLPGRSHLRDPSQETASCAGHTARAEARVSGLLKQQSPLHPHSHLRASLGRTPAAWSPKCAAWRHGLPGKRWTPHTRPGPVSAQAQTCPECRPPHPELSHTCLGPGSTKTPFPIAGLPPLAPEEERSAGDARKASPYLSLLHILRKPSCHCGHGPRSHGATGEPEQFQHQSEPGEKACVLTVHVPRWSTKRAEAPLAGHGEQGRTALTAQGRWCPLVAKLMNHKSLEIQASIGANFLCLLHFENKRYEMK